MNIALACKFSLIQLSGYPETVFDEMDVLRRVLTQDTNNGTVKDALWDAMSEVVSFPPHIVKLREEVILNISLVCDDVCSTPSKCC